MALLACALAAPSYRFATPDRFVVLVVDQSESIRGDARERAEKFVRQCVESAGGQRVAVLPFAGRSGELHEVRASEMQEHGALGGNESMADHRADKPHGSPGGAEGGAGGAMEKSTDLDRLASDPARAVLAAAALMPPDYVREIVLITAGAQTARDLQKAAVGTGVPISVVPLPPLAGPEVCLAELITPAYAEPRDVFDVDAVIESNQADTGTLTLICDGQTVAEQQVEVHAGRNIVPLRPIMPGTARSVLTAELQGFRDTTPENNRRSAIVYASERPRVLILATDMPAAGRCCQRRSIRKDSKRRP